MNGTRRLETKKVLLAALRLPHKNKSSWKGRSGFEVFFLFIFFDLKFLSPGNSSIQLSWRHSNHHRSNDAVKTIVRDGRSQEILLLKKPQDNAMQWN